MKKLILSAFWLALFSWFGVFFLPSQVQAKPKRITCEEWIQIGSSPECKYFAHYDPTNKDSSLGHETYCFSDPVTIDESGTSYDKEMNSRPPDYIADFDWWTCGFAASSSAEMTSPPKTTSGQNSLDCKVLLEELRGEPSRFWFDQLGGTYEVQKQIIERKNGDYCDFIQKLGEGDENSIRLDKSVRITYLDPPPDQIPLPQDEDFEVLNSDSKTYSGVKVSGQNRDVMSSAEYRYKAIGINYGKAGSLLGNCLIEVTHLQDFDIESQNSKNTNSKEELRDYVITSYVNEVKDQRDNVVENSKLQKFCGGTSGNVANSIFSSMSGFFSNLFNSILNIFRPTSPSTLGVTTSSQKEASRQFSPLIVVIIVVGMLVWLIKGQKPSSRKKSKRSKRSKRR
ncbi:MAG: hypothetical protein HYS86_00855 [Candidatus Chisholmbacteria bacterium]|nr:hypothetical protein [Candidatus Chisholmbacteria bacterium]